MLAGLGLESASGRYRPAVRRASSRSLANPSNWRSRRVRPDDPHPRRARYFDVFAVGGSGPGGNGRRGLRLLPRAGAPCRRAARPWRAQAETSSMIRKLPGSPRASPAPRLAMASLPAGLGSFGTSFVMRPVRRPVPPGDDGHTPGCRAVPGGRHGYRPDRDHSQPVSPTGGSGVPRLRTCTAPGLVLRGRGVSEAAGPGRRAAVFAFRAGGQTRRGRLPLHPWPKWPGRVTV